MDITVHKILSKIVCIFFIQVFFFTYLIKLAKLELKNKSVFSLLSFRDFVMKEIMPNFLRLLYIIYNRLDVLLFVNDKKKRKKQLKFRVQGRLKNVK